MAHIASKMTYFADINAASGDQDVEDGQPCTVYAIQVSEENSAIAVVDFKTTLAVPGRPVGTVFLTIALNQDDSEDFLCSFIADAGITADVQVGIVNITVCHNSRGS